MLVLSRKKGEQIRIGNDIVITVHRLSGNRVSLGIEAPAHCRITRGELKTLLEELEYAPQEEANRSELSVRAAQTRVDREVRNTESRNSSAKVINQTSKVTSENRIAAHLPPAFRSPK